MPDRQENPTRAGVGRTYERIAEHFAETRSAPWTEIETFLEDRSSTERGIALGCGNGRHLPLLSEVVEEVIGFDLSERLLRLAQADAEPSTSSFVRGDVVMLPFSDNVIDLCLYVATLHHLPTQPDRQRSLSELDRMLRPGALGLISVWSVSHPKFSVTEGQDRWVDWTLPSGQTIPRYYHLFDQEEFEALLARSPLEIEEAYESGGNCYGIVRGSS